MVSLTETATGYVLADGDVALCWLNRDVRYSRQDLDRIQARYVHVLEGDTPGLPDLSCWRECGIIDGDEREAQNA